MSSEREAELTRRLAEVEAENKRLRESLARVQADRKALVDRILGPASEAGVPTEEELIELMKEKRYPAEEVFRELGIPYGGTT